MAGSIANFLLSVSLLLSISLIFLLTIKINKKNFENLSVIYLCSDGIFYLLFISFILLVYSFIVSDFSNLVVYQNSHTTKPLFYKISGSWGNHEGSMVLFILILSFYLFIFTKKKIDPELKCFTIIFQLILIFIFLVFLIFTSNPFTKILPTPVQGLGLNPILQDPLLAIHPPFLYFGYVGFSIVFSFVLAALMTKKLNSFWSREAHFFILLAWSFLTIGIGLGSFWAYYELGWGGYWFWDPVENASLMPWLAATALLHSNIVTQKKNLLYSWTALLSIFTFILSLLGTFLVRSGVLNSVHAFANDPFRGLYILITIFLIIFGSLTIFLLKNPSYQRKNNSFFFQKDNFILINNCFLIFFLSVVLVGTVYPIILNAINGESISIGPIYYNSIIKPFLFVFIFIMAYGPFLEWNRNSNNSFIKNLLILFIISLIFSLIFLFLLNNKNISLTLGILFSFYLFLTVIYDAFREKKLSINLSRILAHLGFATVIFAIFINGYFAKEINLSMKVGDKKQLENFLIEFKNTKSIKGPNYDQITANFLVTDGNKKVELTPSIRKYNQPAQFTSETSIKSNFINDYYFAINLSQFNDNKISLRFYYKPLMQCLWLGVILIACGGIFGLFKKKYENTI
jgi:cytochrome c-type biogenesis protein CcmF